MTFPRLLSRRIFPWLAFSITLSCFPGLVSSSSAAVTLDSIEIYTTHEWLTSKPKVYFQCKGESKTFLPAVKEAHVSYKFKVKEPWQPLTEFSDAKCKRCGFYDKDTIKLDDVFDEWEFCPTDFSGPERKYVRLVEKEFNATFTCQKCASKQAAHSTSGTQKNRLHIAIVIVISMVMLGLLIAGVVAAYKYWQKKRRQREQARFLKLFEEGDDVEDELDLGNAM